MAKYIPIVEPMRPGSDMYHVFVQKEGKKKKMQVMLAKHPILPFHTLQKDVAERVAKEAADVFNRTKGKQKKRKKALLHEAVCP